MEDIEIEATIEELERVTDMYQKTLAQLFSQNQVSGAISDLLKKMCDGDYRAAALRNIDNYILDLQRIKQMLVTKL